MIDLGAVAKGYASDRLAALLRENGVTSALIDLGGNIGCVGSKPDGPFELWCWKRLLQVPWTARISNQSILKEISSKYSLEGLMLKLKLQYFGHLM